MITLGGRGGHLRITDSSTGFLATPLIKWWNPSLMVLQVPLKCGVQASLKGLTVLFRLAFGDGWCH